MEGKQQQFAGAPGSRWYFWDGGFLAIGRAEGIFPTNAHHVFTIILSLEKPFRLSIDQGPWNSYEAAIIRPDVPHSFDTGGGLLAVLLVEAQSREGRGLRHWTEESIEPIPTELVSAAQRKMHPFWEGEADGSHASEIIQDLVHQFCLRMSPPPPPDPRIDRTIHLLQAPNLTGIRVEDVARAVHLSPSRFRHLFRDQVGISFGRYLLWRRLARAMLLAARGATYSEAAHAAGFADAAHFTRTFRRMFGAPPSALPAGGTVYEIPPPFRIGGSEVGAPTAH